MAVIHTLPSTGRIRYTGLCIFKIMKANKMGTAAKFLGKCNSALSMKSLESESASLFKSLKANKVPGSLSLALDSTLKEGHDMRVFGLGTLASMQSRGSYQQFLTNMHAVYSTMEEELDATSIPAIKPEVIRSVWKKHGPILRRRERLEQDLQVLDGLLTLEADNSEKKRVARVSPNTVKYLKIIRYAGEMDRDSGSGLLLGHLYCRYFADLFGGQMLVRPYELALQLPAAPEHLLFDFKDVDRRAYLEDLYGDLNKAGKMLKPTQVDDVSKESIMAFQHNAKVYSEDSHMVSNAVRGGMNLVLGWTTSFWK